VPLGYGGEPTKLGEFVAIQSGAFTRETTWSEGIVPYGDCSIVISAGVAVTLASNLLELNVSKFDVYGILTLGSSINLDFTLRNPTNIIVYRGGTLDDKTIRNQIHAPAGTLIIVHPEATFIGTGTVLTAVTLSNGNFELGAQLTLGSTFKGPFTCGILPGNKIRSFKKVTYIVTSSGGFTAGSTFLGNIAPLPSICALVGSCLLSITESYILSTDDLDGVLNINFDEIIIEKGATLRLGTRGSKRGFKFRFPTVLNCFGTLQDVTGETGGIFVTGGSNLNFFTSATFFSTVATFLRVYDRVTDANIGEGLSLSVSFTGPYYISVSVSGAISTSSSSNATWFSSASDGF
jgi:hypothetical protein